MNNKGFVVSTLLYGVLIVLFLVIVLLMSILSTNRNASVRLSREVNEELLDWNSKKEASPNKPELLGDMIPVVYDEMQNCWVKANKKTDWYNYDNFKWANAVTITDKSTRDAYKAATSGYKIDLSDVNAFWVWIPRYSYTIKNSYGVSLIDGQNTSISSPGAIDIKWVTKNITDDQSATYTSSPENYYTPLAFCFGDNCESNRDSNLNKELTGIWVNKFEMTITEENAPECLENKNSPNCNKDTILPRSMPSEVSWTNATVNNLYSSIKKNMNSTSGTENYGLKDNDTHMIKNYEWGVVAYLSQSKYGKYNNSLYPQNLRKVMPNNCVKRITGVSSINVESPSTDCSTTVLYDTNNGMAGSTTGNIYGIYDMSGGTDEYVMASYNVHEHIYYAGFGSINSLPSAKYHTTLIDSWTKKSDALTETKGFYNCGSTFPDKDNPWLIRGGSLNSVGSGIFNYSKDQGIGTIATTRAVSIKK